MQPRPFRSVYLDKLKERELNRPDSARLCSLTENSVGTKRTNSRGVDKRKNRFESL